MAGLKTLTVNGMTYKVAPIVPSSGVTLLAAGWVENEGVYSQVVELAGVTSHTKVDLQPTPDQDEIFRAKTLAFVAENDDGVVTVFSVGDRPRNDYTIQVTMTEVEGEGKIRGNTVGVPNPQADWKQTDPTKADYIKNKPNFFIISDTEPTNIPALWFNTAAGGALYSEVLLSMEEDESGYPVQADVGDETYGVNNATVNQGATGENYDFTVL